jgi:hypothetical protein
MPGETTTVTEIPRCDLCAARGVSTPAYADAKLNTGPWANVCRQHFSRYYCKLGVGRGQRFVLAGDKA